MLEVFRGLLKGKLTYITGGAMILSAISGFVLGVLQPETVGALDPKEAVALFLNGLGFVGLRRASK